MGSKGIFVIKLPLCYSSYYFPGFICNPMNNFTKSDKATIAQVSAARCCVSITPAGIRAAPHLPTPRGSDVVNSYISHNIGGGMSMPASKPTS